MEKEELFTIIYADISIFANANVFEELFTIIYADILIFANANVASNGESWVP